jgi:tetratricopeptide (TPR) repeat protein
VKKRRWLRLLVTLAVLGVVAFAADLATGCVRAPAAQIQGHMLLVRGDAAGALVAFDRALAVWPDWPDALLDRANARSHLDDWEGSVADAARALELQDDVATRKTVALHYHGRGNARFKKKNTDGCVADLTRARELDPDSVAIKQSLANGLNDRALRHSENNRWDGAVADILAARELDPQSAVIIFNAGVFTAGRGKHRLQLGDMDGAIVDTTLALELFALRPDGGRPRKDGGNKPGLVQAFAEPMFGLVGGGRTWTLSPLASVYHFRAEARSCKGDLAGADADYGQVLQMHPECFRLHRDRGLVRLRHGRAAEAQQDFQAYLREQPEGREELEAAIKRVRAPGK